jgi:hypothetical protein
MGGREKSEEEKPPFDSGSGPGSPQNRRAARVRGLAWNPRKRYYVDSDGDLMRDRFGQPL